MTSAFFQIQLNGKKAKKKESKEKKIQRTEMEKKENERRKGKKLIVAGGIRTNSSLALQLSKIHAPLTSRPTHPTDNVCRLLFSPQILSVGCIGREVRGARILLNCQATELLVRIPPATINFFPFLLFFFFFFISVLRVFFSLL